jgi:hypothetical protein
MFSKKQADIAVKEKNIKAIFLLIASLFFSGSPWGRTGSGKQPYHSVSGALREGNIMYLLCLVK